MFGVILSSAKVFHITVNIVFTLIIHVFVSILSSAYTKAVMLQRAILTDLFEGIHLIGLFFVY